MAEHEKNPAAVALGRRGGQVRAQKMSPEERRESSRNASRARWEKPPYQVIRGMLVVAAMTGRRYVLFRDHCRAEFAEEGSARAAEWLEKHANCIVGTYDAAASFTEVMMDMAD